MKSNALIALMTVACFVGMASCTGESSSCSSEESSEVSNDTLVGETVSTSPYDQCVGEAIGGAHSSIFIKDANGDTTEFEYSEIPDDSIESWDEGDQMVVTYIHNPNPAIGDSVISLHHKK